MDERYRVVTGVAGAGKTSYAMDLLLQALRDGLDWSEVGFLSFSRAACGEATRRAAKVVGESEDRLTRHGWFRTIHSACARAAGIDTRTILDPESADGREWYESHLGCTRGGERGTMAARIAAVLDRWDLARQTLSVLEVPAPDGADGTAAHTRNSRNTCAHVVFARVRAQKMQGKYGKNGLRTGPNTLYGEFEKVSTSTTMAEISCSRVRSFDNSYRGLELGAHTSGVRTCAHVLQVCAQEPDQEPHWALGVDNCQWADEIVGKFEDAKRLYGMNDFVDLLIRFAGLQVSGLRLVDAHPLGLEPDGVKLWLVDEAQDCSPLLWAAVDRLCCPAEQVVLLGDPYQAVYRFLGADPEILLERQNQAADRGDWTLLNRSWRNPDSVLEWGEDVLRQSPGYVSRGPVSESGEGTAALMDVGAFERALPLLGRLDCLIIARTWFALQKFQTALNSHGIPWTSVTDKHSSMWDSPAKLAVVLTCRDLAAGLPISEQDWRRLHDHFPSKSDGGDLFIRGTKAKWKKIACSGEPDLTLAELDKWGAGPGFAAYITSCQWRQAQYSVLDWALEQYGVDIVRNPRVRLGTVHSVKGLEAQVVFCLAASTQASAAGDAWEELNLKYVAITRASSDYRLVVDQADQVRGKPLFWAGPLKGAKWDNSTEWINERIRTADENRQMARESEHLGGEDSSDWAREEGPAGSDLLLSGTDDRLRSEDSRGQSNTDAGDGDGDDRFDWWTM